MGDLLVYKSNHTRGILSSISSLSKLIVFEWNEIIVTLLDGTEVEVIIE